MDVLFGLLGLVIVLYQEAMAWADKHPDGVLLLLVIVIAWATSRSLNQKLDSINQRLKALESSGEFRR
jgi:hypothetical protein